MQVAIIEKEFDRQRPRHGPGSRAARRGADWERWSSSQSPSLQLSAFETHRLWSHRHQNDDLDPAMGQSKNAPPVAKLFGDRVRAARHGKGWSLEQFAEVSGLHWTYVGSVERGQRNPSLLNIVRLAEALDVNPADLVRDLRP